jgi:hypothetical protein
MARSTRAVAAFRVEAAMERRLSRMRVRQARELSRPAHWRSEEEYQRNEVALRNRGWKANPFHR